MLDRRL